MRHSTVLLKNPVIFKQGQGMFTHQLKHLLQKKAVHRYNWDPVSLYPARNLWHADRLVDHHTYEERHDPHWDNKVYEVPDQEYSRIPVPSEYKDAYWFRDLQARRIQCPVEWVSHRMYSGKNRNRFDFQDLAMKAKFRIPQLQVIEKSKQKRS
jgi:hypothetical protein